MTWNYRIVQHTFKQSDDVYYSIHEVHYDEEGSITGYTQNPVAPLGASLEELRGDITRLYQAFDKPILNRTDLEKERIEL